MLTAQDNFLNSDRKLFLPIAKPVIAEEGGLQKRLCYNPALPTY
jgi:hypothetical protein